VSASFALSVAFSKKKSAPASEQAFRYCSSP
jgi:hypothetical protein